MHCPHCDQYHPEDSQFCTLTGKQISKQAVQAAQDTGSIQSAETRPKPAGTGKWFPQKGCQILIIFGGAFGVVVIVAMLLVFALWIKSNQDNVSIAGTVQPASFIEDQGRIVFVSNRDGNSEIYVMDADGSHQTRLTYSTERVNNDYPAWSPDGQKIAFVSDRGGIPEIYVMNADGSDQTLLRDIPADNLLKSNLRGDFYPDWSPDGQRLAFVSNLDGAYKVCIMDADGSAPVCLAGSQVGKIYSFMVLRNNLTYPESDQIRVSWCADGQTIAYSSSRSGSSKIYVISADGSFQSSLSNDADDFTPKYSADGLKIAFVSTREWPPQIYVMNADGSAQTALTHDKETSSLSPSWSADGRAIVFQSDRDGNYEIYVMNADGSQPTRLTNNQAQDWNPDWSW